MLSNHGFGADPKGKKPPLATHKAGTFIYLCCPDLKTIGHLSCLKK
jgi:hypothetical protein